MARRYHAFGDFLRNRFGEKVYKISVDAGFTCPNRDGTIGTSGCVFCNNDAFRASSSLPGLSIKEQIARGMSFIRKRYHATKFLVYFQPFTNTYAPVERLEDLYEQALSHHDVVGLAIGTRPDTVDGEKIALLERLARDRFILVEYGMQSMYEKSLDFINRGHGYREFLRALDMTKGRGIWIGAHVIVGLPTETRQETLAMAGEISRLPVDFLKIHHLQVLKDTLLEVLYRENPFPLFAYNDYLDFIVAFLERLSPRIAIQRLFATAPDRLLIAPRWDKSRQETLRDIERTLEKKNTYQGKRSEVPLSESR